MGRSARSSALKTNNQKLKKNVFGPVETARTARLSARLLEIASQPKPQRDVEMAPVEGDATEESKTETAEKTEAMEVESGSKSVTKISKGRIAKSAMAKRKLKKSSMVFAKYGEKKLSRKGK